MNEDIRTTRMEILEDTELPDELHLPPAPESWSIEDFDDILRITGIQGEIGVMM